MGATNISSLLLAACIAIATLLVLLMASFPANDMWLFATVSLVGVISFLVIRIGHRWLVYRNMMKDYNSITAWLQEKTKFPIEQPDKLSGRPLEALKTCIDALVVSQQTDIDNLKRQETFRANFLADVSHELKTPIFAAQGFVHTLLDGAMDDEKVRKKFLQKAAKSLDGLNTIVQDLLTLSRIEMGAVKMKFENIDWYHLCTEVVDQFGQRGSMKVISIQPPSVDRLLIVRADWPRMVQVMNNLLSNAIKYSDEIGKITIQLDVDQDFVTTSVIDTGIGISDTHLDRIFERFYRVEKSRSKEKGGTGLGLSIVKNILEQHCTKIHVQSQPGKGSVFSFRLKRVGSPS